MFRSPRGKRWRNRLMKHRHLAFLATAALFATQGLAGIRDYGLKEYVRISRDLPHSDNETWKLVCTMPYNCHFQPWIEVEAPANKGFIREVPAWSYEG